MKSGVERRKKRRGDYEKIKVQGRDTFSMEMGARFVCDDVVPLDHVVAGAILAPPPRGPPPGACEEGVELGNPSSHGGGATESIVVIPVHYPG